MINILVTGVGGGVGQGIVKSLRMIKDLDIRLIVADMSPLASGLYSGDFIHMVPSANSSQYMIEIEKICNIYNIDYYFPGTDVELISCAKMSDYFKKNLDVDIFVSPLHVIEIADDKLKTSNFLKANGYAFPETLLPSQVCWDTIVFPVIVKPRVGCRSIGVYKTFSVDEAKIAIDSLTGPIVQEYLDGDEYTCTVAVCSGVVSDVLCLKRDLRAGDTFRAFPIKSELIENYVRSIAIDIGLEGSCNFQLRLNSNGMPVIFEINSRFSGTTPFCSLLGFNPVEFCLKSKLGLIYSSNIDYTKVVLRHWCEVVVSSEELRSIDIERQGSISESLVSSMM